MIDISLISAETPLLDEKTAETMRGVFPEAGKSCGSESGGGS